VEEKFYPTSPESLTREKSSVLHSAKRSTIRKMYHNITQN
jgi:hypothetical protein